MAAITHATTGFTADASLTTSFATKASIASGNFVAGRKYLILYRGIGTTTAVNGAILAYLEWATSGLIDQTYSWCEAGEAASGWIIGGAIVVTSPDPVEQLNLSARYAGSGTNIIADFRMIVIDLEAEVTENTDWFVAVDDDLASPQNVGISGAFSDFATLTQTFAAGDWLVIGYSNTDCNNTGASVRNRVSWSGGGLTSGDNGNSELEGETSSGINQYTSPPMVFSLDGTSATFKVQTGVSSSTASHHQHRYSSVFAINMAVFEETYSDYTAAEFEPSSASTYEEAAAITPFTPTTAGDWVVLGGGTQGGDNGANTRVQVGGTSLDSANEFLMPTWDVRDNNYFYNVCFGSFSGSTDIDFDFASDTTADGILHRTLVAFSLELAGAAGPTVTPGPLQKLGRQFNPVAAARLNGVLQ